MSRTVAIVVVTARVMPNASITALAAWVFIETLITHFNLPILYGKLRQIGRSNTDNLKVIFLFLNENICCDPSLEPSRRDGFNEGVITYVLIK